MPVFEECSVLIPAATLEDFPADLSDYDARSMLAAWTVLWHPQLLAATNQLPTWYRADSPPEPKPGLLVVVSTASAVELPPDYSSRIDATAESHLVTGASRAEFLSNIISIGSDGFSDPPALPAAEDNDRIVSVDDFYAAGYASLQIQVMTRRLRYTSNLDEIHLQNRAVDAAKAFLIGNTTDSIAALHDVFDALAQERDHYFSSSDPHLIDLTLASASTAADMVREIESSDLNRETEGILATPRNVLIDQDVANALIGGSDDQLDILRRRIADGHVGWAGGGPSASLCLDTMTMQAASLAIDHARSECQQASGVAPVVFARFTGGWPGDMTWSLASHGYRGLIPIDFAAGSGHADEAKVILETGRSQIEALTAKPFDAASDSAFLNLGAKLGEAIDGGEISTALFAHWPGQICDSYADVRRAASWSLCLGRFWKLDDYFTEGEHPYHHGKVLATSKHAAGYLDSAVEDGRPDPISSLAKQFRQSVQQDQLELVSGLADLAAGIETNKDDPLRDFCDAVIGNVSASQAGLLLINPVSAGSRVGVSTEFPVSTEPKHVFASSQQGSHTEVTVDVPGCGFVLLRTAGKSSGQSRSLADRLRGRFASGQRSIATTERSDGSARLQNEFMEVVISPTSGGVSGVYSGSVRGNRFSMKLVGNVVRDQSDVVGESPKSVMKCKSVRVGSTSPATGSVIVTGSIHDSDQDQRLAGFTLQYSLNRGSRTLQVTGELSPVNEIVGSPWQNYIAARAAVSGESAICRPMVRDKVHRRSSRNLVAPLGVVIDEAERQTLIASGGLAFHRVVADRFLDTLLLVQGESQRKFDLSYGFDVPTPVATSRSLVCPTFQVPVSASAVTPSIGWMIHASPKAILVSSLAVDRTEDGRMRALLRIVQTQPQPCTAIVRFLRDVESAVLVEQVSAGRTAPATEEGESPQPLETKGDRISVSLPSHGVADVMVVFCNGDSR